MTERDLQKLILAVKQQDEAVDDRFQNDLWETLYFLAGCYARKRGEGLGGYEKDKLEGKLIDRAMKAVASYSPGKGVPFKAWLRKLWRQELISFYRARRTAPDGSRGEPKTFDTGEDRSVEFLDKRGHTPHEIAVSNEVEEHLTASISPPTNRFASPKDILEAWREGTGDVFDRRILFRHHAGCTQSTRNEPGLFESASTEVYAKRRFWKYFHKKKRTKNSNDG